MQTVTLETVTLEEAQARLPELISSLNPDQKIMITCEGRSVAMIARPVEPSKSGGSIFDIPPLSVGKVLNPEFSRAEVWDEMIRRDG